MATGYSEKYTQSSTRSLTASLPCFVQGYSNKRNAHFSYLGSRPPAQTDIFVSLTELDICMNDIDGCLAGLVFGYHQFIGLQKLTLVTHRHWADIRFTWAQNRVENWLKPRWLTIFAWVPSEH